MAMINTFMYRGPEYSRTMTRRKSAASLLDETKMVETGSSVVVIGHKDIFVNTMVNYLRQTREKIWTMRSPPWRLQPWRR